MRVEFWEVGLTGPDWTTTVHKLWLEVRMPSADLVNMAWGLEYTSPVQRDNKNHGNKPECAWAIRLETNNALLANAAFGASFDRRCSWDGQTAAGTYDFHRPANWPFGPTLKEALETSNGAVLEVSYATRVTWCK